jgi:hypothetical protein
MNHLEYAGAAHDPVAAVVLCQPRRVDHAVVGGQFVVKDRQLTTLDERQLIVKHARASQRLLEGNYRQA